MRDERGGTHCFLHLCDKVARVATAIGRGFGRYNGHIRRFGGEDLVLEEVEAGEDDAEAQDDHVRY